MLILALFHASVLNNAPDCDREEYLYLCTGMVLQVLFAAL